MRTRRPLALRGERLVFRGPPGRPVALFAPAATNAAAGEPVNASATLIGVEVARLTVRPLAGGEGAVSRATLRLPTDTPPGRYEGVARIAGRQHAIAVEVEPYVRVQSHPSRLVVEAAPGGEVAVEVVLLNGGNVPFEVPARSSFCLFRGDGVHHALWAALTSVPPAGKQRVDLLLDDLAGSHGGLVDVRLSAPTSSVAPGGTHVVRLKLGFSDRLDAGRDYGGTWEPAGLRIPVRVSVSAPARKRRASRAVA